MDPQILLRNLIFQQLSAVKDRRYRKLRHYHHRQWLDELPIFP